MGLWFFSCGTEKFKVPDLKEPQILIVSCEIRLDPRTQTLPTFGVFNPITHLCVPQIFLEGRTKSLGGGYTLAKSLF